MIPGFAWTIPLIQFGFGILFFAARRAGAAAEAGSWARGFLSSAGAFAVPAFEPVAPIQLIAVTADVLFAVAFYHFAEAIQIRFGGPRLARAKYAILAVSIAAPVCGVLVVESLTAELVASDVTCAMQLALALMLIPFWPRAGIDRAMIALSWVVVADNLMRTASLPLTAAGASFSSFLATSYGYLMQVSATLTGFTFAILALFAVMTELLEHHRRIAEVDPLKGLLNRRGLEALVSRGKPAAMDSVVSCDLDHFKHVNDTWGHEVGDRVLAAFGNLMRGVLPPLAGGARIGGEEFVVYLPADAVMDASAIAARLQAAMTAYDWTATGRTGRQSASFGLAVRGSSSRTLMDLVGEADQNLYKAKKLGRDRIFGAAAGRRLFSSREQLRRDCLPFRTKLGEEHVEHLWTAQAGFARAHPTGRGRKRRHWAAERRRRHR